MSLYDRYQLANSTQVQQYQGSVVPELAAVSEKLQQNYDAAQQGQDMLQRYWDSMQSLEKDRAALEQMGGQYRDKLKKLSGRKDLENTVRETALLAQDLPAAYAPFAQRMQQAQAYQAQLQKEVAEGKINPKTAQRLMAMSNYQDKGIQVDPRTGRYTGSYQGAMYVGDVDMRAKVDEYMKNAESQKGSIKKDTVSGQWLIKNGQSWDVMSPEQVSMIIQQGMANDQQVQAWLAQEENLATFDKDFSDTILSEEELNTAVGKRPGTKKGETIPITMRDILQQYVDQGISTADALKDISRKQVRSQIINNAQAYGLSKYVKNNVEQESGLQANQVWKWNQETDEKRREGQMLHLATTMTLGQADVQDMGDYKELKTSMEDSHKASQATYGEWLQGVHDGKKKIWDKDGNVWLQNPDGSKGVNVTADAQRMRESIEETSNQMKRLQAVEKAAAEASGFDKLPAEVKRKAERARQIVEQTETAPGKTMANVSLSSIVPTIVSSEERKRRAQEAYDAVLKDTKEYKLYEAELKKRFTGTAVGSDLFAFRDKKTIDAISDQVTNLVSGLGLEKGAIPVYDKDNNQLTADQWDELKGDMQAIGVTYTGDPRSPVALVMRAYKDVKGKKTAGEDMIVKLNNTNIQQIAAEGMSEEQAEFFNRASKLAVALDNPFRYFKANGVTISANTGDPRNGWFVTKGGKGETLYSFKDILNFIDSTPDTPDGK